MGPKSNTVVLVKSSAKGYLVYKKWLYLAKILARGGCHDAQAALTF